MIELRTLGALQLLTPAGVSIDTVLAQPRRTALLCYLALARPRGFHSRDTLYAVFWPEHDTRQARHALRQSLYFVRRALGPDTVVSRADGALALAQGQIRCDAWEFERAVDEARAEDAFALYGGDLLTGFHVSDAPEFERWLDEQRSRLRQRAADAAWAHSEALERAGNAAGAVEWARRAITLHPADETMLRRQILQLGRLGYRTAALRAYQAFAAQLDREYELEPSGETRALVERICAADEERTATAPSRTITPVMASTTVSDAASLPLVPALPTQPHRGRSARLARRLPGVVRYGAVPVLLALAAIVVFRLRSPSTQEIAKAVARELGSGTGQNNAAPRRTECTNNLAAHEFYLRGSDGRLARTDSGTRVAEKYLKQAIAYDPQCAAAYAKLAWVYLRSSAVPGVSASVSDFPRMTAHDGRVLARETALKALALDETTAEAHLVLGNVLMKEYEFARAESEMRRALQLDSTFDNAPLVQLYIFMRRPKDALDQAERKLRINSISRGGIAELAHALLVNGRCPEAMSQLERLANLDPPLLRVADVAAQCYARMQMWSQASQTLQLNVKERGARGQALIAFMEARAGNKARAQAVLDSLLALRLRNQEIAFPIAIAYAGLADLDQAFVWLNRSITDHSMSELIMEPLFEEVQRDPRFDRLLGRLGLKHR